MQEFLEAAQRGEAATSDDRERVWRAVKAVTVPVAAPSPDAAPAPAGPAPVAPAVASVVRTSHAAVFGAMLFVVGVVVGRVVVPASTAPAAAPSLPTPTTSVSAALPVTSLSPPTVTPSALPSAAPVVASAATPKPSVVTDAPKTSSAATSADEALTILHAKRELGAGRPGAALAALDEHERTYPHGALSEERDALRVLALCAAGKIVEGRAERARFLRAQPISPYAERVGAACPEPKD